MRAWFLLISFLLSATAGSQTPCLSPFQRVAPARPFVPGERLWCVEVEGRFALALSSTHIIGGSITGVVHAFEQDALTGSWSATQSFEVDGLVAAGSVFEFDGDRAVGLASRDFKWLLIILARDKNSGLWFEEQAIEIPDSPNQLRAALGRIAIGFLEPERFVIYARQANGTYAAEGEIPVITSNNHSFILEFDFDGLQLVSTEEYRFDVYRRNGAGHWALEASRPMPPRLAAAGFWEKPLVADGRMIFRSRVVGGGPVGLGFWRLSSAGGWTSVVHDGIVTEIDVANVFERHALSFAKGTALTRLREPTCGTPDPDVVPLAVLGVGRRDVPELRGQICALAGFANMSDVTDLDYDGRTIAAVVPLEIGAPPHNIHFASLLGADLDRDHDCVEDALQIAVDPALDRNVNAVLDAYEVRGTAECVPGVPNSSGGIARLRIVGREVAGSGDLTALVDDLPPNALGWLLCARSPTPSPPSGPVGLCIGSDGIGRYAPIRTSAEGTATIALQVVMLPSPFGPREALAGETWAWQLAYRDGSGFGATSAIRVLLE